MSETSVPQSPNSEFFPEIRRARFYQLTIYEVAEAELEILEKGSPDSIFLNFSIFLLSTAIAFTISLLTTTISSTRTFTVLIVLTSIGYLMGILLFLLWARNRTSVSNCVRTIRNRLPPEGIRQDTNSSGSNQMQA